MSPTPIDGGDHRPALCSMTQCSAVRAKIATGFRVSAAQRDMCRRFAVEPSPPGQQTMVGFALSRPRELEPLNALRHPIAGSSNGWFVWRGPAIPQEDDKFAPLHVEHLDEYAPELGPYLALPPGWGVVLAPDYEDVWYDETLLDV